MVIDLAILKSRLKSKDTLLLAAVIIVACLYFVVNVPQSSLNVLRTVFDKQIPRIPIFAIPYLLFLPWFWSVVVYAWYRNRSFRQLAFATIIVNSIAFIVYLTFQTYVPREAVISNDFFSGILRFIYDHDQAYNGFPSLHSALSATIATYFIFVNSRWSWAFVLMAALIVVSTLFVKQHFIADAVSGVTLGVLVTWLSFKVYNRHTRSLC